MKRREIKVAACIIAGIIAASGSDLTTNATQVSYILPVAGVGLTLQEGTSVDDLENIDLKSADAPAATTPVVAMAAGEAALTNTGAEVTVTPEVTEEAVPDTAEADAVEEAAAVDEEDTDSESNDEYGNLVIAQVNDWVNVRSIPSTEGDIIGKLYNNSVGEMIRVEGDWYYIASGTISGYVKAEYCVSGEAAATLVDQVSIKKATVMTTTLYMREEPTTDSKILMMLPLGDELDVTSTTEAEGWVQINVNDTVGYVSADYVSVSIEFISAESKEEEEARLAKEKAEQAERDRLTAEAAAAAASQTTSQAAAEPAPVVVSVPSSGTGSQVANYALQFVGNPYVYGGTSLTNGADCSGFVLAVYAQFGVSLPHSAHADRSMGTAVGSLAEAQPGDLVCYSGHVGIYIGNGQIVHASTPSSGIKISSATYRSIACIRRIFN